MTSISRRFTRALSGGVIAALIVGGTVACSDDVNSGGDDNADGGGGDKGTVRISGQDFGEATLVAAMYEQVLENEGYDVDLKLVKTRDSYMADFGKGVDVVPEYLGGIVDYVNTTENGEDAEPLTTTDAQETIDASESLLKDQGIDLLEPSEATDTNAYFVSEDYAEQEGVSTLSDMEGKKVVLAAAPDCEGRSDCEAGLKNVYGIDITELLPLGYATAETYNAVLDGEAELGQTSTTDGTLADQGLVLLEDDKSIQPAQNLIPMVSSDFLADHEDVAEPLNDLMAALTTENLTELNGRVLNDREKPEDVARDFLESEGLV